MVNVLPLHQFLLSMYLCVSAFPNQHRRLNQTCMWSQITGTTKSGK